jgi:hypothetical protein
MTNFNSERVNKIASQIIEEGYKIKLNEQQKPKVLKLATNMLKVNSD